MPLFSRKQQQNGPTDDEVREQRLEAIKRLCERFSYDLGLLIAGHPVAFEEYMDQHAAARLRDSVEPFLATGDAMRPNFGEYGELRVEGNLLDHTQPIYAFIEFDDQSVRETAAGELIPSQKRRMLLSII